MRQVEQDCLDRRDRTGQPGHESQDVTGRNMTGKQERQNRMDRQIRTGKTGQTNQAGETGQAE